MSLERAYKNCKICHCTARAYACGDANVDANKPALTDKPMNEALRALEEERNYSAPYDQGSRGKEAAITETALKACVKCDKDAPSIADLLEKEFPDAFKTQEKQEE